MRCERCPVTKASCWFENILLEILLTNCHANKRDRTECKDKGNAHDQEKRHHDRVNKTSRNRKFYRFRYACFETGVAGCWRRPNTDPPCRSKNDPGRGATFLSSSCG